MLWCHVYFKPYNASPHTLQYSCLDKLRVLSFMSAEHDVRVKTLLPKGANRTNSQPSSQDRCQSHWCCRAVFKSVLNVCSGRNTAPTHSLLILEGECAFRHKHLWWVTLDYNRRPHQPERVITVRHRDFSGLVSKWKISRIWSAGNCKKLTPTLAQSHDPFIITYNCPPQIRRFVGAFLYLCHASLGGRRLWQKV